MTNYSAELPTCVFFQEKFSFYNDDFQSMNAYEWGYISTESIGQKLF